MKLKVSGIGKKLAFKIYKKASSFFQKDLQKLEIYSKSFGEICKILKINEKKMPWYAAGFIRGNSIYVVNKKQLKGRGHKETEFDRIVLHELCHIFINSIVKKKIDAWVSEGICQYISFKPRLKTKLKNIVYLKKLKTYKDWYKQDHPYIYCALFFDFLIKRYRKEKILQFLYSLKREKTSSAFSKSFNCNLNSCEKSFRTYLKNEKII